MNQRLGFDDLMSLLATAGMGLFFGLLTGLIVMIAYLGVCVLLRIQPSFEVILWTFRITLPGGAFVGALLDIVLTIEERRGRR